MKITKQRLKQIIQEEVNSYKASQLNESIDMDTLENLEVAIKMAYEEMTTPTDVDQVYADTGEPVSKDPQDMHKRAVEFLIDVVRDVARGEMSSSSRTINEDGHTDIPSAARKMKLAIEDAGQILAALEGGQGELPSWWMSKVTIAADYLNKARDYLLVPSQGMEEGFMDKLKQKLTPKPDDRSTIQKIADHGDMYKLGPARGPIVMALSKLPEEELNEILILLNSVPGTLAKEGQVNEGLQDVAKALAFALMVTASPQAAVAAGAPTQTAQTGDPAEADKLDSAANLIGQALRQLGTDESPEAMKKVQDVINDLVDDEERESGEMEEKLKPSMGAGAYVDDFRKSKAPQFKGKSKKKKQQMAIAAYLDDKDSKK